MAFMVCIPWFQINHISKAATPTSITATFTGGYVLPYAELTKDKFNVTLKNDNGTTQRIYDFDVNPTYLTTPGTNTISISYYTGSTTLRTSCTVECLAVSPDTKYYITFLSEGGSYVEPIYNITPNTTVTLPTPPTRTNYWFRGWYTDTKYTTEFTEFTKVNANLQLYAKWEEKTNGDSFTATVSDGKTATTVTIDLAGHTYDSSIMLYTEALNQKAVIKAAQKIAKTDKFLGIEITVRGYMFDSQKPLPISMTIPTGYDYSKTAVFYTTNRTTVMSRTVGEIKNGSYCFNAYESGTYILMECEDVVNTTTTTEAKPTISLNANPTITVNEQTPMIITWKDFYGDTNDYEFKWKSSNTKIASVDNNGIVTGKKIGKVKITCTSTTGNLSASATLKVLVDGTAITKITPTVIKKTFKKGSTYQLNVAITPKDATLQKLTYTSSNKNIATVSSTGKITAKKKGTCVITIKTTDGTELTRKVTITVTN